MPNQMQLHVTHSLNTEQILAFIESYGSNAITIPGGRPDNLSDPVELISRLQNLVPGLVNENQLDLGIANQVIEVIKDLRLIGCIDYADYIVTHLFPWAVNGLPFATTTEAIDTSGFTNQARGIYQINDLATGTYRVSIQLETYLKLQEGARFFQERLIKGYRESSNPIGISLIRPAIDANGFVTFSDSDLMWVGHEPLGTFQSWIDAIQCGVNIRSFPPKVIALFNEHPQAFRLTSLMAQSPFGLFMLDATGDLEG